MKKKNLSNVQTVNSFWISSGNYVEKGLGMDYVISNHCVHLTHPINMRGGGGEFRNYIEKKGGEIIRIEMGKK